jgi:cell division protein FtsW
MAKRLQADKWLFAATVGLALFGVVMVYSASAIIATNEANNQFYYVAKQAIWTLIGFGAMLGALYIDYRILCNRRVVLGLLVVTVIMLLAVFGFSKVNGAHRWIKLGLFSIQPSELAKFATVVFLAYFLEQRQGEEHLFKRTFLPCALVTGLLAALVLKEPDLGTGLMLAAVCVIMCFTAGTRVLHLAIAAAPALLVVIGMLIFVPFRVRRLLAFADPWAFSQNEGYQVVQSLIAIGSGGVHGLGFAQGKQKMFFLPFAHSDFIFAIVSEELGLVGALIVVLIFALFMWRGLRAALSAPDRFGTLLGVGIVSMIVVQALFNISVVLSLVPNKGIPLPFISYGGSSLVPTLFSVGLLLNISQHGDARPLLRFTGGGERSYDPDAPMRRLRTAGGASFSVWRTGVER